MAKQTFTTGQVLTAAQVNSLQQTAMLGGAASTKTTSYVLVAADAGTSIAMNSTSATTITVNTGLFAAGDTVTIVNQNTGVCTVTAGTATVRKASGASLALSQYQGGILDFISASEAIFFPFDVGGATSPLTTKGDLWTYGTGDTRLGVGTTNQVLTVDSSTSTGLKWAAVSADSLTLLSTTTLSSATTTVSSISGAYKHLYIHVSPRGAAGSATWQGFQFNSSGGLNVGQWMNSATPGTANQYSENLASIRILGNQNIGADYGPNQVDIVIYNYAATIASSPNQRIGWFGAGGISSTGYNMVGHGTFSYTATTGAIDSFSYITNSASFQSGQIKIYGWN